MQPDEVMHWLKEEDEQTLEVLWKKADETRREYVGNDIHLRGIIEISNYCVRLCHYCGINAANKNIKRYLMTVEEIMNGVKEIESYGYGTVVLQAGEDARIKADWIAEIIKRIKNETSLSVTLSLGERKKSELELWKKSGADRYLLKIETGNQRLFKSIHPTASKFEWSNRIQILFFLLETGYETGSGIMVGIPGQTYNDILTDIFLFKKLGVHMLGIGPFLPHPETSLGKEFFEGLEDKDQVPNTELMTYKVNALTRIICKNINIPTTTALATINSKTGRELGLKRGANVIMPNFTPIKYRQFYEIYPGRICLEEFGTKVNNMIHERIKSVDREIGYGPGSAIQNKAQKCI
ncbi:MAG: [FeFe] hydrogenase H-cluster radical SAM maturase HydE [Calditrichaeota bacterium]|nr:MAG: [FeFe] hydrogenase H-cluster radical SAM maturase HydE [Calditrichota bacterium]MBL1206233.1 [FeFe] hydrogenase H-cluster radical SAM maturase HydE [Calditrichota bacterium]NOG46059.1 [FeFe] hydrogenase H-cluster radical SAM maturase HydE [Calditrichota bacterium]